MKCFSLTLPATTNYYNLWTLLNQVTGFAAPNEIVPERCCHIVIGSDSGTILIADKNYANQAGMPLVNTGSLTLSAPGNAICLREIYLKGSGLAVSGWFVWI